MGLAGNGRRGTAMSGSSQSGTVCPRRRRGALSFASSTSVRDAGTLCSLARASDLAPRGEQAALPREAVEDPRDHVPVSGEHLVAALPVEQDGHARGSRELHHLPLGDDARRVERLVHVPQHGVEVIRDVGRRRQHRVVARSSCGHDAPHMRHLVEARIFAARGEGVGGGAPSSARSRDAIVTTEEESRPPERQVPTGTSLRRRSATDSKRRSRTASSKRAPPRSAGAASYQRSDRAETRLRAHREEAAGRQLVDALEHRLGRVVGELEGEEVDDPIVVRSPRDLRIDRGAP